MAHAARLAEDDPRVKLDRAAIAPPRTRRVRAAAFQSYVIVAASAFITLAVIAHTVPYFPIDLTITRALQAYHGHLFARGMFWVSWIGFMPQVIFVVLGVAGALFAAGLRWEGTATLFAACGALLGSIVKIVVYRPRPSANLIHVFQQLPSSGFPSGHVLEFTTFGGFLIFLAFTLLKPSAFRTGLLTALGLLIGLMGLSRIYQGQHWFSDVMGAYLFGSLWLMLTIRLYRWGKTRFFPHQPVAPNPAREEA